jgi:hypothetical protein
MSVAFPQQWSEEGFAPQAQSRTHPISRTRPGNCATIFFAPATATLLHAPTVKVLGAGYPPKPVAVDAQHLNAFGPGHWFEVEEPAQSEVQRQFAPEAPQEGLAQHFTSEGSEGQPPDVVVPPAEVQLVVLTQTPRMG